jgi:phosphohistidine phosphatase SixA
MRRRVVGFAGLVVVLVLLGLGSARAAEPVWDALRGGGQIVMLRHASTEPGLGDPPGFRLDDCATQRNLSEAGRAEARRIGAAFVLRAVPVARVLSSRWCRCVETARLAFGRVESWASLDSFFDDRSREPQQTRAVHALIAEPLTGGNLILVTHQVNIAALTGIAPATGEMIVLSPEPGGSFKLVGRLGPADVSGN